jgi:ATP-dependent DNA helicase RecG
MPESRDITLRTPIDRVPGVGDASALALRALGLTNLGRLIAHLPMRYERLEAEAPIAELLPGQIISARGEVTATRLVMRGKRPRFEAVLMDPSGRLDLVWFNATYMRDKVHPGMRLRVQGKAKRFGYGLQIANPSQWAIDESDEAPTTQARLRPVYPASEAITSRQIERIMARALPKAIPLLIDHLSEDFRRAKAMPTLAEAYRAIHDPSTLDDANAARRRLAYDELLFLQLGVALKRRHLRDTLRAPALRWNDRIDAHIRERFAFIFTPAQDGVVRDVVRDLTSTTPTNRLIQGDVGSGKTAIALYAMLMAVGSGQQAALMAPTELLAEQHLASIERLLKGSKVRVELLTGATTPIERESILSRAASGEIDILIGTHSLLTSSVRFNSLAVAVIDEQHRFGVSQRAAMRSKSGDAALTPHVLVMTATPIPRTLAITLFGDLDISTIAELPPGRQAITTRVVGSEKRAEVYAWVRTRIDAGEQAYIVAPAIEPASARATPTLEDDAEPADIAPDASSGTPALPPLLDVRSLAERLESQELAGKRVAVLHGRLRRSTREAIMERFRAGHIDALVATTVIEVGVDVPNASVMVVENAERFGLAQLHQLRGRVGRGSAKSACVLIADPATEEARARLDAIASTRDGFVLAERDFEQRGPGVLFGLRQSGAPPFRVADLARDLDLLKLARHDAAEWIARSPHLDAKGEALLRDRLLKAHGQWLDLGDVG